MSVRTGGLARVPAVLAASILLGIGTPLVAAADAGFTIGDSHVKSPAGLTADVPNDRYWAVAAGSGQVRAWALDASGVPLGPADSLDRAINVQAATAVGGDLYIGDVGGIRNNLTIWKLTGPVPTTTVRAAKAYRLRYPDGAHASRAMMVDDDKRIYVITSGSSGRIYRTPKAPKSDEMTVLEKVASAPEGVVDAVMLPGGQYSLRTASKLYFFDENFKKISSEPIEGQPDGEALAMSLDGKSVIAAAGSQGSTVRFSLPPEPERPAGEPGGSKPKPKPTATRPADGEKSIITTFPQTGTAMAIVGAIGAAVLAGLVVLVRR